MNIDLDALRREANELLDERGADAFALRSCWECNAAHERLKSVEYVIHCFACGQWYFKGHNITIRDEE